MFFPLFEILTVGFPFCAFKIVSGLFFMQHWLLGLGLLDLFLNVANFLSLLVMRKKILPTCFFTYLINMLKRPLESKEKWEDLGNSLDVLFSFLLVAFVIGGGHIPQIPATSLMIWNISVILNVIGAGAFRMSASIQSLKAK